MSLPQTHKKRDRRAWSSAYRERLRDEINRKQRLWYKKNRDEQILKKKIHYNKNKSRILEASRRSAQTLKINQPEEFRKRIRRYQTTYTKRHFVKVKLKGSVYRALRTALKYGAKKKERTIKYLGCTIAHLRKHIEKQFSGEMCWSNYGRLWSVDHIHPLASFDLTKEQEMIDALNYSNLRPLLAIKNSEKSDKIIKDRQPWLI